MDAIYDDNINLPLIQNTKKQSHTETLVHSMRTGFILLHSLVSIVLVSALVVAALATSTIAEWLPSIMWGPKKEDSHADGYRVLHFLVGIALVLLMCNVIAIYALCTAHKKIRVAYIILLCAVTLLLALHVTVDVMVARGALDLTATWEAMVQRCHTGNDTHRGENCACELEKYLKCSGWSQPCAEPDNVSTPAAVDMMPLGEGTESWGLINPLLRFRRDMITNNNNNKDEYRNVASRTPAPSCPLCSAEDQKIIDHYQRTCSSAVSEYYRESSREHATTYLFIAALLLAAMTTAAMIRPKQQVDLVINGRHLQFTSIQMEL